MQRFVRPALFGGLRLAILTILLCAALAAPALYPGIAHASRPVRYEYVFLIDTSGSMSGKGPGDPKVIFPKVQSAVNDFVGTLGLGDTVVYVYPFSGGLGKPLVANLHTASDKRRVQRFIRGLKANGSMTAIYDSMDKTLDETNRIRKSAPKYDHVQTILLFTDGRDTSKRKSLSQIVNRFKLARGENPFLFLKYVTLGTSADSAWSDLDGVEVVRYPKGQRPTLRSVRIQPTTLDFGSVKDAGKGTRVVEIAFDEAMSGKQITLSATSEDADSDGALVSVKPPVIRLAGPRGPSGSRIMRQTLTLETANKDSLQEHQSYQGKVSLGVTDKSLVTFSPPELSFAFNVSAASQVRIEGPATAATGALGMLDPYSDKAKPTRSLPFRAVFNNEAEEQNAYVTVRLKSVSGPSASLVTLLSGEGAKGVEVRLTPQQSTFTMKVDVKKGAPRGDYVYALEFEPSNAQLTNMKTDAKTGTSSESFSFAVPDSPAPPTPLWKVLLTGFGWALLLFLVLAVAGFVALCVATGVAPPAMAGLLASKISPKFADSRLSVVAPASDAGNVHEITGRKSFRLGASTGILDQMPVVLLFTPEVSLSKGRRDIRVEIEGGDGSRFFDIYRGEASIGEPANRGVVNDGDEIAVRHDDGGISRVRLQSYSNDYRR